MYRLLLVLLIATCTIAGLALGYVVALSDHPVLVTVAPSPYPTLTPYPTYTPYPTPDVRDRNIYGVPLPSCEYAAPATVCFNGPPLTPER